jgi:hypothetical protein
LTAPGWQVSSWGIADYRTVRSASVEGEKCGAKLDVLKVKMCLGVYTLAKTLRHRPRMSTTSSLWRSNVQVKIFLTPRGRYVVRFFLLWPFPDGKA